MTQKVLWIVTIFFISVLTLMFVSKTALASEIFEPVSGLQVTNDIVVLAKPGQDLTPGEHLGYQLISSTALLAPQNIQKIAIAILEKEMPDGVRRKSTIRTPDLRSEWPAKQTTLVLRINYAALSPETPDRDPAVALTVTALYPLFKESGIRNWYRTAWESYPSIFFVDKDLQVSQRNLEEAMSGLFAHIAQNLCLNLGKYSKSDLKSNCTKENE